MTVIKNLAFSDKKKLKNLSSFTESELDLSDFHSFPADFLHHFLPFKFKFLNESFVAIENKKIIGLITVNKAGEKRLKISRLLLEENSLEIGKLLVNCTMTLFLSKGAESFYVVIDKMNTPLILMFKEGLGFQSYAKEIVYKIEKKDSILGFDEINFDHIRKMRPSDIKNVSNLINGTMQGYKRPTFKKTPSDIKKNFLFAPEQYIICGSIKELPIGYFTILESKKSEFLLEFVIDKGYEGYVSDIIKFTFLKLSKKKKFKTLFVKLKSYYTNFDELKEILNMEYAPAFENEILVKDFMVAKKQEFTYERMIFNDATPAF
ncbi:MAG: hypothetical protein Q4F80_08930 [bacterium]|nr:hypothetical protein [bacterium]